MVKEHEGLDHSAVSQHVFPETIVANATSPLSSHPNIIMHDGGPGAYRQNTVDSLQRIITFYKSRGYKFTNPAGVQEPRLQIQ